MAIVGVITRFRAKKLGAPIKKLMGIKLVTAYREAKIPILEIIRDLFILASINLFSLSPSRDPHRLFSYEKSPQHYLHLYHIDKLRNVGISSNHTWGISLNLKMRTLGYT